MFYEIDNLEEQDSQNLRAAKEGKEKTVTLTKESYAKELMKETEVTKKMCKKNKSDRKLANYVSYFSLRGSCLIL